MFIRHYQSEPSSATFRSIERAEAPRNTDVAPPRTYYDYMQMLAWNPDRELLLIIANEVRSGLAAMAGQESKPHPRPWERPRDNGERAAALLAEYNSPEARAAREAVTGTPQLEGS